ncbi:sensor domain-containing diguanylate cyclase [Pseudochelatococcus contaminans]|uniref:Diguanylate cyclase (GGDEF)-like protein/PAS domain S-box-containing protein n=1 Tax=Pseudochelatococcus contaminans TaxID=1538103 RepID=A0A7W5Z3V0_9HYPH|nr:PAS domain S-box protein [Pseudochelatococcus contaminans]MBB3809267.1 diguanylate cyclase (GGDEF)-like protein/PAS domain S-box-containing protein [Pseudochelatococcus contaminans]
MKRILRRRIAILTVAGLLTLLAGGAYWTYLDHVHDRIERKAIENGEASAEQLAYSMAEHTSATIRQIDYVLRRLTRQFMSDPGNFSDDVRIAADSFPVLGKVQLTVIGADGRIIYSTVPDWAPIIVDDSEHFKYLSTHDSDELFIGHPIIGRFSKTWYLPFARRMERDGQFAGLIVLSISPQYISQIMRGLDLGPDDSAGLVLLSDGAYLARNNAIESLLGKHVKASRPYLQPGAPETGVFVDESTHDHISRIYAWRRLAGLPLVTFVGLSESAILAPVQETRGSSLVRNAIMLAILVPSTWAAIFFGLHAVAARRQLFESEALYRSLFERNVSIKMIIDPTNGRIVAANPSACAFYGYDHDRLVGMSIAEINQLAQNDVMHNMDLARNGQQEHFLFDHRTASGEIRNVEVYSGTIMQNNQELLYSIIHDVTDKTTLKKRLEESETRYRMLFRTIPEGLIVVDKNGAITDWNTAALSILGVDEKGLKERSAPLSHPTGEPLQKDQYPSMRAIESDKTGGLYFMETAGGKKTWIYANSRRLPPMGENGDISAVVVFSDMSHVISLEESALISHSVFDVVTQALLVTTPDFRTIQINPAFYDLTGYTPQDVLERKLWDLDPPLFASRVNAVIIESLQTRRRWSGEVIVRRKNGTTFRGLLNVIAVYSPDDRLLRYVGLFSDITEQRKQEKERWRQANFDALTDLPNRTLLNDRARQALAQTERKNHVVGILFIDLDKFKPVNDTHGHAVGDILLREVATRMKSCIRAGDTVSRVGGDEFVILLPIVENSVMPRVIADRILTAMNRPFHLPGHDVSINISASIGVACSFDRDHVDAFLKRADDAMYLVKKSGGNGIGIATIDGSYIVAEEATRA